LPAVSYAIIGAGGFLGVGKHDVAIRVSQLKESDGKLVLAGETKEAIMPQVSTKSLYHSLLLNRVRGRHPQSFFQPPSTNGEYWSRAA
jgi:hypothetical protein